MLWGVVDPSGIVPPLGPWSALAFLLVAVLALAITRAIPSLGLALLILADPFAAYHAIGPTTTSTEKAVLAGVVLGLLLGGLARTPRRAHWLWIAFAATVAASLLSGVHAGDRSAVVRETLKQIEYGLLAWCGCAIAANAEAPLVEQALCAATTLSTIAVCGLAAIEAVLGGAPSGIWFNNVAIPRVAGPLEGPNQLAGFLEVTLPVLVLAPASLGITAGVRSLAAVLGYAALVLTQSRTGIAATVLESAAAFRLDPSAFGRLHRGVLGGLGAGAAIAAVWYGVALAPLLAGKSTQIVVAPAPAPPAGRAGADANAAAALEAGEPRVAFVAPDAPVRILSARVRSIPLQGGNRLVVRMIATSNAAAATIRVGRISWGLHRAAFGVFADSIDVPYAAAPSASIKAELTAIRTDDAKMRRTVAVAVRYDPHDVRIESFQGLQGAGDLMLARAIDTQRLQDPGTVSTRRALWHAALVLFRRSPLTGVGAGNYQLDLAGAGVPGARTNASSLWLQVLAEQGVIGFAALVALVGVVVWGLLRGPRRWYAYAALLATATLFAHQIVDDLNFFPKIAAPYWLLVGTAFGLSARARTAQRESAAEPLASS